MSGKENMFEARYDPCVCQCFSVYFYLERLLKGSLKEDESKCGGSERRNDRTVDAEYMGQV